MKPLTNSAQNAVEYPDTWVHPATEITTLKKGMYIKVGVEGDVPTDTPGERFWAKVSSVSKTKRTATAVIEQSDMLFANVHGYHHADTIKVGFDNIMAVMSV